MFLAVFRPLQLTTTQAYMVIWRSNDLTTALHFSVNADDFYFKRRPIVGSSKFDTAASLYTPAGKLQAHTRPCSVGGTSQNFKGWFTPTQSPWGPSLAAPTPLCTYQTCFEFSSRTPSSSALSRTQWRIPADNKTNLWAPQKVINLLTWGGTTGCAPCSYLTHVCSAQ